MRFNVDIPVSLPVVHCTKCNLYYYMCVVNMPGEDSCMEGPRVSMDVCNQNFYCPNCGTLTLEEVGKDKEDHE
jgi:hypothetical protein